MSEQQKRLNKKDKFNFKCHKALTCFNQCCRDINIVLTPYDILRMKQRLNISSEEFHTKYTLFPFTKEQKLPVVLIKMDENNDKKCPFVTKEGCSIYKDRPWACRMFPIGLASPKSGTQDKPFYFLLDEPICQGLKESQELTVEEWIGDQGIEKYDEAGEVFKEVSLHDFLVKGGELGPQRLEMFHTVCYDLDKFRRQLLADEGEFFNLFEIDPKEKEAIAKDDEALLLFGFRWLRFSLFGEKLFTMTEKAKKRVEDKVAALKKAKKEKAKDNGESQ